MVSNQLYTGCMYTDLVKDRDPPQLLMAIYGEPGTGKTATTGRISDMFFSRSTWEQLTVRPYSRVKSLLVDSISHRPSPREISSIQRDWSILEGYLIIEDSDPNDLSFFALLSHNLCIARNTPLHIPFGGLNIIITADCAYLPNNHNSHTAAHGLLNRLGNETLLQFREIIILHLPMRTVDPVWWDLLRRIRFGRMDKASIELLRTLILPGINSPNPNTSVPWTRKTLITSHDITRRQWNTASLRSYGRRSGLPIYICTAQDSMYGLPLTAREKYFSESLTFDKPQQLNTSVAIALGMPVIVTLAFQSIFCEEGSLTQIVGITLDPADADTQNIGGVIHLKRLPLSIRLRQSPAMPLITLRPSRRGYHLRLPLAVMGHGVGALPAIKYVNRLQYALAGAYAISDIRSQGAPLCTIVADISNSASVKDAYATLSRSINMDSIRLLRDFDDSLFKTGFDDESHAERRRLAAEHDATAVRWEKTSKDDIRYNSVKL